MKGKTKKKSLRVAGVLLSMCMLGGTVPLGEGASILRGITAHAEIIPIIHSGSDGNANYEINYEVDTTQKTVTITEYASTEHIISLETLDDYPITSYKYEIGEKAFYENDILKGVIIPDGYVRIGNSAFEGCKNLEKIYFDQNNTLKEIAYHAFYNCTKLDFTLPNSVETIGKYAFMYCKSFKMEDVDKSSLKIINGGAFNSVNLPKTFVIPKTVEKIERAVFYNSTGVECVDMRDCKVSTLSESLFYESQDLKSVILPSNVPDLKIEDLAFGIGSYSKKDKSISIYSYDTNLAFDTKELKPVRSIIPWKALFDQNTWGNWRDVFEGMENIDLYCYPNSALDRSYKYIEDASGEILSEYDSNPNGLVIHPQIHYLDKDYFDIDDLGPFIEKIPAPLPGKQFSKSSFKITDAWSKYIELTDVSCYDASGKKLEDGYYFDPGNNYYYTFTVTTRQDSKKVFDFEEFANWWSLGYDYCEISDYVKELQKGLQEKAGYNIYLWDKSSDYISAMEAKDCQSPQSFTLKLFPNLNKMWLYHIISVDVDIPDAYPYEDSVTKEIAGEVGVLGLDDNRNINYEGHKVTLYKFAEPKVTVNGDTAEVSYVFDSEKYHKSGVPDTYYTVLSGGKTISDFSTDPTITGLEPGNDYTLQIAVKEPTQKNTYVILYNLNFSTKTGFNGEVPPKITTAITSAISTISTTTTAKPTVTSSVSTTSAKPTATSSVSTTSSKSTTTTSATTRPIYTTTCDIAIDYELSKDYAYPGEDVEMKVLIYPNGNKTKAISGRVVTNPGISLKSIGKSSPAYKTNIESNLNTGDFNLLTMNGADGMVTEDGAVLLSIIYHVNDDAPVGAYPVGIKNIEIYYGKNRNDLYYVAEKNVRFINVQDSPTPKTTSSNTTSSATTTTTAGPVYTTTCDIAIDYKLSKDYAYPGEDIEMKVLIYPNGKETKAISGQVITNQGVSCKSISTYSPAYQNKINVNNDEGRFAFLTMDNTNGIIAKDGAVLLSVIYHVNDNAPYGAYNIGIQNIMMFYGTQENELYYVREKNERFINVQGSTALQTTTTAKSNTATKITTTTDKTQTSTNTSTSANEAVSTTTAVNIEKSPRPGDVNNDNTINLKDVVMLRRYIAGGWGVTIDEYYADVNGDGTVNLKDVVMLRRYIAGGWGVTLKTPDSKKT